MPVSKRELAALWSARTGFTTVLEHLPRRPLLMILNYHRIGNPEETPYDPGTFSATAEELDRQIACLKKRYEFVTLDEAVSLAAGRRPPRRAALLLTFDDGYRDNFTLAFPVLRSHGVQGVFFLPTYYVGTNRLPWWDVIAYVVKRSRTREIRLRYPEPAVFHLDGEGLAAVLRRILLLFKQPAMKDTERFLAALEEACDAGRPDLSAERCFLDWREALEMQNGGMAFGSHTHSHEILSKLDPGRQLEELTLSRRILESHLHRSIDTLAYPVGARHTFSNHTVTALRQAGYRCAFSQYGGCNRPGRTEPFNIQRRPVDQESIAYLRLQTALGAATAKQWS